VFSKNSDRLTGHDVGEAFFTELINVADRTRSRSGVPRDAIGFTR
jgi:hypothetical protein